MLKQIVQSNTNILSEYMLVRVPHADGGFHVHVYLELVNKVYIKDPRRLDLVYKVALCVLPTILDMR